MYRSQLGCNFSIKRKLVTQATQCKPVKNSVMKKEPIWELNSEASNFPQLANDIEVEVAIIGGGITGISTAQLLKEKGINVAVLEAHSVGKGTSGRSTGNLYTVCEYTLKELKQKYNLDVVRQVIESRKMALDHIETNIHSLQIDCDFKKQSMYIFDNDDSIDFDQEETIAKKVGLPYTPLNKQDFPFNYKRGIEYKEQAQFNALKYVQQMVKHIQGEGCMIYENSTVLKIDEKEDAIILKTEKGNVKARYIIHATHTPKGLQVQYHTTLGPYREYGIAARLKNDNYPEGIFWGYYDSKKYSIRSYKTTTHTYLICVGSMHKVGQAKNNQEHIDELIAFVKRYYNVAEITHAWGAQNYKPADLLPYIGVKSEGSKQYIATGFSADGLIYGVTAAMILVDQIAGEQNPYSELYKASRHQPLKAAEKFTKENLNVAAQMVKDLATGIGNEKDDIALGEGKIVQSGASKLAVYKDGVGNVTVLSALCPHMGCVVHWNNAENSWDCPCHGSRFSCTGEVIEGPAFHGLERKDS